MCDNAYLPEVFLSEAVVYLGTRFGCSSNCKHTSFLELKQLEEDREVLSQSSVSSSVTQNNWHKVMAQLDVTFSTLNVGQCHLQFKADTFCFVCRPPT